MSIERTWQLIARKNAGEITPQELLELEELLRLDPDLHFSLEAITEWWSRIDSEDPKELAQSYDRHRKKMLDQGILTLAPKPFRTRRKRMLRIGIAVAAMALIILFLFNGKFFGEAISSERKSDIKESVVSTRNGSRTRLVLPDGTLVWLNSDSELSYKEDFGTATRTVNLKGEAYFDVIKDAEKPFYIYTPTITIRVTGTILNVKSYPNENHSEASLIRGSIEVRSNNESGKRYILKPKEKLIVMNLQAPNKPLAENSAIMPLNSETAISHIGFLSGDSSVVETSWVENKLIFQNEPLGDLVKRLTRWYGVEVELIDADLSDLRFTGNFEHESVTQALSALQMTGEFSYERLNNKIIIHK